MVDYESAIKKPFTDVSKLIIGIVMSLVPIINLFSMGFIMECSGFGKTKASKKMPELKNWTSLFFKGLAGLVISFLYIIPAIVVFVIGFGVAAASIFSNVVGPLISSGVIESAMQEEIAPSVVRSLMSQNWPAVVSSLVTATPILLVGLALYLLGIYLTPVAIVNYLKKKRFGGAFELGKIIRKAFTAKYFVVWLVNTVILFFTTWILAFIPVLGGAVGFFVVGVITYSLYGQVLKELKL
jgi:hypothetical protein